MLTPDDPYFAALRRREFARLDVEEGAYLDYTGAALFPASRVSAHADRLLGTIHGNPHSDHAASRASADVIAGARASVLRWLDADPADYTVIFTANASAAIRIIGESYPFGPEAPLVLSADNHNSVNGMRRFAQRGGAPVHYLPLDAELRLAATPADLAPVAQGRGLFAFPAQSNFSGVRHPTAWIGAARERGYDVLLDAAAYVPTNPLRLRELMPEFVVVSLYKVLGYPTGVGALIARTDALERLERPWFAGGTVEYVRVATPDYRLKAGAEAFEDGTPDFLALAAVEHGLEFVREVGVDRLQRRVACLTGLLLDALADARHPGGAPMVRVYGPGPAPDRGGVVAFNILDPDGDVVAFDRVECALRPWHVAVRGGCFCNPGAGERAFQGDGATGALRASFGVASTAGDIERLIVGLLTRR